MLSVGEFRMWPLPNINNNVLSIALNDATLTCSWIQPAHRKAPNVLKAYASHSLPHFDYTHAIVFNPTYIKECIQQFILNNKLEDAYSIMSVSGKNIIEAVTTLPVASPQPQDFAFPKLRNLLWDYQYLYPTNNEQFAFYVCGITQPLLMQYQLMATVLPMNLIVITTERMALLTLYKHQWGAIFRHTQLARDMVQHNNDIHSLFTTETIRRNLSIKPSLCIDIEQEKRALLASLGLFFIGKDLHAAS